jgi:hypothetical protein
VVCGWRDGLGLATSTSRRPLRSRPPLERASFLPGRVGKGVISGYLQKKMLHGRTFVFGLRPVSTPPTPLMVGLTVDVPLHGLNEQPVEAADWRTAWTMPFEVLDCHARRVHGLSCEAQTLSGGLP